LNVGIVDPVQVQGIAASGLERQGGRTSCLGFGDGYNETLLGALAKATNGDFHDVDSPEKLPAIFAHELDGLQALAVQNLRVRLKRLDFCEHIFGLNDYPFVTLPDGRTEIAIGDLVSEEERVAVFALEVLPLPLLNGQPVASLEGEALLEAELAWDEISATGITSKTWSQVVRVQATQNPAEVKANETVLSWVAVQRAAKAVREASARAAAGDEAGARHQLNEEVKLMESAGDAPVVREALGTLREAQAQLDSAENSSRKGKLMFLMSSDVSRQSSRRRPSGPADPTGNPA
jgi:Ca-activated chloride channel family protein